jgi:hypothetical protein
MVRPLPVMFAAAFVLVACGGQQKVPLPAPDADQTVDDYLSATQAAFTDNDLVELQRRVLGGSIPYEVDGQIITQLAAKAILPVHPHPSVGAIAVLSRVAGSKLGVSNPLPSPLSAQESPILNWCRARDSNPDGVAPVVFK